jgi:tetratricopeptide (TPR) repeat protein
MKPITSLLFATLLLHSTTARAVPVDSLLSAAAAAYAAGDPSTALSLYTAVLAEGSSAPLLYNIGNCHYRVGDHAMAILHYERALKMAPGDDDIRTNLELARSRTKDRVNELPVSQVMQRWDRFAGGRDIDQWARISIAFALLFFALLAVATLLNNGTWRTAARILSAGAGVLLILSMVMAWSRHRALGMHEDAIVMAQRVDVRSEPTERGAVLFVIHRGTKVHVMQELEGRLEVRLANGGQGWLQADQVERI